MNRNACFSTHLICLRNVEEAIQNLPPLESDSLQKGETSAPNQSESGQSPHAGEESARPLSINTPVQTLSGDAKRLLQKTGDTISKPLNALGRIFTEALDGAENKFNSIPGSPVLLELGQEQRENGSDAQHSRQPASGVGPLTNTGHEGMLPVQMPYKPRVRRGPSPTSQSTHDCGQAGPESTSSRSTPGPYTNQSLAIGPSKPYPSHDSDPTSASYLLNGKPLLPPRRHLLSSGGGGGSGGGRGSHGLPGGEISRVPTPSLDFAGVQAEIDTAHEQAARAAKETLRQIFPGVDDDVVNWVLEAKGGDLGKSIEALLEISSGT